MSVALRGVSVFPLGEALVLNPRGELGEGWPLVRP